LVAYLAAGGWRLVAGLPTAAWRLWLGENGSALSVALITVVITLTGPAARAAGSRLWPATRQARGQGAPDAESGAVLAGGERHPGTGQECTTAPGGARSSPAPPAAGTVATRVGEVLESFLREQEGTLAEIDTGLSEMTAPLVRLLLGGGKRLRPLFCYWGWRGAGQPDCAAIIAAAAAFELLHGCALVHDDVMDDSGTRRGLPTMHRHFAALHGQRGWRGDAAGFGTAAAILLGDLCLSWSDELLDRSGLDDQRLGPARRLFWRTRTELIGGQYLDIQTQAAGGLDLRHAGQVARYKTSKYTIERPLQIGALLAGAPPDLLAAYSAYALPLGEAFQLRDDLLGVFGDPARTGKPAGDDLRAGKPTALICLTAELANASGRAAISRLLGRPDLGQADLDQLREIIVETGAPARVEAMICSRLELTLSALDQAFPDDPVSRQALSHLAVLATDRIQ
jgi:geranylgeranyl diphosphate synthase type I